MWINDESSDSVGHLLLLEDCIYTLPVPLSEILILALTGVLAGMLGGLLGIGGSIIIIPALTLLLHRNQQLSQASAMIINVVVAVPSMMQHHRARAVRWDVVLRVLPSAILSIIIGVEASNRMSGEILMKLFGCFLLYVIYTNVRQFRQPVETGVSTAHDGLWLGSNITGAVTGFIAGLLGVGGGIIAVPLLQRICRLPLRQCIATSSAVICLTATVGAVRKNMTLGSLTDPSGASLELTLEHSVVLAALIAPTAIVGALVGAKLAHVLPLNLLRASLIVLLAVACARMLSCN